MTRIMLGAIVALAGLAGWQFWRAERLEDKAARYDVCKAVQDIRNGVSNETDDDLSDSISRP